MTTYGIALLIAATSIALTWFCCIRPMRRGKCAKTRCSGPEADAEAQAEIEALSHETAELRRAMGPPRRS